MTAGGGCKLPFGNFPRLILAWVCTEAVQTQSRELVLGRSLAEFMRALGVYSSGGGNVHTKLRNQLRRLFNAHVQLVYKDERGEARVSSAVADRTESWWNERKPDERVLWNSKIRLGEDFFNEIISHPVPIDMNTLTALKRCALGLDLYLWLVYRTFALTSPLRLSWSHLYHQFDADPSKAGTHDTVQYFRRKVLRELKKIKLSWPELNYATAKGILIHWTGPCRRTTCVPTAKWPGPNGRPFFGAKSSLRQYALPSSPVVCSSRVSSVWSERLCA